MKTNYTICPSCKREVYYDTFIQNVGECEGCHFMGPEWVLENVVEELEQFPHQEYDDVPF